MFPDPFSDINMSGWQTKGETTKTLSKDYSRSFEHASEASRLSISSHGTNSYLDVKDLIQESRQPDKSFPMRNMFYYSSPALLDMTSIPPLIHKIHPEVRGATDEPTQVRETMRNFFHDSAYEFPHGDFPTFDISEIIAGRCLGSGGFSHVAEIRMIRCTENNQSKMRNKEDSVASDNDESRTFIAKHCVRESGDARYAIKRLRDDILKDDKDRLLGIADLVIETRFLSNLEHPNIIKLRGIANVDPYSTDYFVVLDRLYDTLKQRMQNWKKLSDSYKVIFRRVFYRTARKGLLHTRLAAALDLAYAFEYLHDKKIVHRDIKPDNIGFDIRGDIKIFDFGMARDLVPLQADQDGLYHLTKMTGSLRYMAPEVGLGKPYNEKCDVYSYSIVLWEMLNLSGKAYCHIPDEASFCEKVFVENVRPPLKRKWSVRLQKLLQEGWDKDPAGRPTMVHIRKSLLAEIQSCFLFEHDLTQRRRSTFLYQGKPSVNSEDNETRKAHAYSYSYDTTRSSILSYSNRSAP